jgi:hypothetical protein
MAFTDTFMRATISDYKIARALPWRCDRYHKRALLPPKAAICSGKLALFAILRFNPGILFFAARIRQPEACSTVSAPARMGAHDSN